MCLSAKRSECGTRCKNVFGPVVELEIVQPAMMKRKTLLNGYLNCPSGVLRIGVPETTVGDLPDFLKRHCVEKYKLSFIS